MKKLYIAPELECLAFLSNSPIGNDDWDAEYGRDPSQPWNDGELGWT